MPINQSPITNNHHSAVDLPNDVVLRVDNVSKKFCRNLKRSLWYGLQDLGRNMLGGKRTSTTSVPAKALAKADPQLEISDSPITDVQSPIPNNYSPITNNRNLLPLRPSEFWALQNISFELKRGECLGLIGPNGCGKSTLLRLIAGIFPPDEGRISFRGRVGALIALGAGFHPHLTGRENVFLNGAILGLSQEEIKDKFSEIIEFAEIGDFLDAPVATYSSGMRVRLGFAVASVIEPDLLLIDEILAVGDRKFRAKCCFKNAGVT